MVFQLHLKPRIGHFRVFGCPEFARKWTITTQDGKRLTNKTSQCSVKGIFIGLPSNQQGYLIYMPQSNRISVSMDASFDESFASAIVLSWNPFQDAIRLLPNESSISDEYDTLEHTGSAEEFPSMFEEGNENGILYKLIQNQLQYIQNKETPSSIEEYEEKSPPQKIDDSSDDSSTESNLNGQVYTKPLDISEMQTPEEIPELS